MKKKKNEDITVLSAISKLTFVTPITIKLLPVLVIFIVSGRS